MIIDSILNKWNKISRPTFFEDVGHEQSVLFLLSLTDSEVSIQSKFTDDEKI